MKRYTHHTTTIYLQTIACEQGQPRRKAEQQAETDLLQTLFGDSVTLQHDADGKPYLFSTTSTPLPHISISHSRSILAIAMDYTHPIGIDVEELTPRLQRVQHKFMPPADKPYQLRELALCWSAKEAVYKLANDRAGAIGENVTVQWADPTHGRAYLTNDNQSFSLAVIAETDQWELVLAQENKPKLAVLIDPEKLPIQQLPSFCQYITSEVDYIFVGGSGYKADLTTYITALKQHISQPVILFPGHPSQFTPAADALLFLSLLSGRNAELLIGQQVATARLIQASHIKTIPMGYILVDGGKTTTVQQITSTEPLRDTDTIVDTAIAAQLLGFQVVYLEAGSGADRPVQPAIIQSVREKLSIPLIVGGGICNIEQMQAAYEAGADIVVIGNHFEQHPEQIPQFAKAKIK